MNKSAIPLLLMLFSIGTNAAPPTNAPETSTSVDNVTAKVQRERLRVLSAQIVVLRDQIYSDYNKLNSDHQYDIVCTTDVPTDTHFKVRQCLPAFFKDAQVDAAMDFLEQSESNNAIDGYPARPVSMVALGQRDEFKRNFWKVMKSHPELVKLGQKYGALERDYEATLSHNFKG